MKQIFNLEYNILDKLSRARKTIKGGFYATEEKLAAAKKRIEEENTGHNISFNVYIISQPILR